MVSLLFLKDESGATAIEYGLIVALLAIVVVSSTMFLQDPVNGLFASIVEEFQALNNREE